MELKQIKKGERIYRPSDGRFIGYAAADGILVAVEPHEIASYKRCFVVTDMQLVQIVALNSKPMKCPVGISMEPVE